MNLSLNFNPIIRFQSVIRISVTAEWYCIIKCPGESFEKNARDYFLDAMRRPRRD